MRDNRVIELINETLADAKVVKKAVAGAVKDAMGEAVEEAVRSALEERLPEAVAEAAAVAVEKRRRELLQLDPEASAPAPDPESETGKGKQVAGVPGRTEDSTRERERQFREHQQRRARELEEGLEGMTQDDLRAGIHKIEAGDHVPTTRDVIEAGETHLSQVMAEAEAAERAKKQRR